MILLLVTNLTLILGSTKKEKHYDYESIINTMTMSMTNSKSK